MITKILEASVYPVMRAFLRRAALLPVGMKIAPVERVVSAIARRVPATEALMLTNLGVDSRLRCRVPAFKSQLLYGSPRTYVAERATVALARCVARLCDDFVDVGANEGIFALTIATDRADSSIKRIHVFEPDHELFARLNENFDRNDICAELNRVAISGATGTARFYRNLSDDLSGSLTTMFAETHRLEDIEVQTTTLTEYFNRRSISRACVKVDVEGASADVWAGAVQCSHKIDWLICEMLAPDVQDGLPARIISEGGYHGYYIRDFDLVESRFGEFDYVPPFYNWIFCRVPPDRLRDILRGTRFRIVADQ